MSQNSQAEGRDPHEAIREAENALRDLIQTVLEPSLGAKWLDQSGVIPGRLEVFQQRKAEEQKRRHLQHPEARLLYYADLSDLRKIIEKHWEKFKPFLADKREFDVFISRLEDFRNPDAHQRGLLSYEADLAFGISGQFRQALAVSRRQVEVNKYYPGLERVVDNFGFTATPEQQVVHTGQPVKAGDTLTYRISAWNPHPEEKLEFLISLGGRRTDPTTGDTVSIRIEPRDIDRTFWLTIHLRSARSRKLDKLSDDSVHFFYVGIPD